MQRSALLTVGNLAFCLDNRRILVTSETLRELLLRLTVAPNPRVNKAAARALAILGLFVFFFPSLIHLVHMKFVSSQSIQNDFFFLL